MQFNDVHVTWLLVVIEQPLRRLLTFFCEVGTDHRDVERRILGIDVAVSQDDRDLGGLGFLENCIPARRHHGGKGDDIDFLRDIATNGLDLVLLLLLRIGEFQFDTRFLGRFLD